MRVAIVVNPGAGKHRAARIADRACARLGELGHEFVVLNEASPEQAVAALTKTLDGPDAPDIVAIAGGDGALHNLLPVVVERGVKVAMLPAGAGNDTARTAGLRPDDPDTAITALLEGETKKFDVMALGDGRFVVTVIASGFDSKVNERANAMNWPRGITRYNLALMAELRAFRPLPFRIVADGHEMAREAMLVAVGNTSSFGGGMRIAEGADPADGVLDIIVIHPVSKPTLARVFPRLYTGTHTTIPEFERIRAREVTWESPGVIAYGDGERLGPLPMTARVVPGALTLIVAKPRETKRHAPPPKVSG
jgi:diacylglycerol kinase (ATP)